MLNPNVPPSSTKTTRLYYLDWLRVLAILMVFLFHSVHVFDLSDWSIKNAERSEFLTIILVLLSLWGMPFFFLIAGTSSIFALQHRTPSQYVRERFNRLFIPSVVGTILFWFPMVYLEWANKSQLGLVTQSFQDYLSGYWTFYAQLGLSPLWLAFGKHMWFLGFLFSFSIISLPILIWLKRDQGARVIAWLARLCEFRGGILVFVLPLVLVRASVQPFFPKEHDWSDFIFELSFFILGFILFADERFARAIRRDWWLLLTLGTVLTLSLIAIYALGFPVQTWSETPTLLGFYLLLALATTIALCNILTILFVGMRWLDFTNKWLTYAQEAVLPFFILHQPIIIVIAFYVVQWQMGILPKMLVVVTSSFVVTVGLYEWVIKRVGLFKTLFGMTAGRSDKAHVAQ